MYQKYLSAFFVVSSLSVSAMAQTFQYGKDVPKAQIQLLESDLSLLGKIQFQNVDPEFYKVSDFEGSLKSGQDLYGWMKERIRYVVGEKFFAYDNRYLEQENYNFDFPNELPDLDDSKEAEGGTYQNWKPQISMQNLGPTTYLQGKKVGRLLGLKVPGLGRIPMSTPRVGLIQVGPAFFRVPKDQKVTDYNLRADRVATLLHEARHSDGRGVHVGMPHIKCPINHIYSGFYACDFSLNGAYSVGAHVGKALTENCNECSVAEKEKMRLNYLDSFSRVIKQVRKMPLNEEMAWREACEKLKDFNFDLPKCDEIKRMDELNEEIPQATYWNSQPEGRLEQAKKRFFDFLL